MSVTKLPATVAMLIILCLALIVSASCLQSRIIGGTTTTIDKHPYQVSIHYDGKLLCGGSIISKDWILTAAHCVYGFSGKLALFKIRVASSCYDEGGTLVNIASIIHHEMYDDYKYTYDVGLIKLANPLSLNKNAKSITLATSSTNIKTNSNAIVTGWGQTSKNGAYSKVLQVLTVPIVDQEVCRKIYFKDFHKEVTSDMLCAGYITGEEKDTCQRDSGGPLVYDNVQIGIVSWGPTQCASGRYPGVYTRISAIRNWITKKANV